MTPRELKAATLAAVRREVSPTRGRFRAYTSLALLAAGAAAGGAFWWAGGVRVGPRPASLLAGAIGGELAIAAAALWFGLTMSLPPLGRSRARFGLLLALTPAALFAWKVGWSARYPDMLAAWPGRIGLRCLALTLAMGLPLLVTLASLRRDSEPLYAGSLGAALGIAVGGAAWAPLDLWCPVAHPQHVLIGHVAPSLLLAAAGGLLGRYVMEMRAPGTRR